MRIGRGTVAVAAVLGCFASATLLAAGCASKKKWEPPEAYTDSAAQAAEHAQRLAEAERKATKLTQRAIAADDDDDHEEAVRLALEAIRTYPELGIAWHTLGVALLAQEERQRAWECFSRAAQLAPMSPEPLYNMGVILQENLLLERAKRYHMEALDRNPSYLLSLRESIRIDRMMDQVDRETVERISRALLLEQDENWRDYYKRTLLASQSKRG